MVFVAAGAPTPRQAEPANEQMHSTPLPRAGTVAPHGRAIELREFRLDCLRRAV